MIIKSADLVRHTWQISLSVANQHGPRQSYHAFIYWLITDMFCFLGLPICKAYPSFTCWCSTLIHLTALVWACFIGEWSIWLKDQLLLQWNVKTYTKSWHWLFWLPYLPHKFPAILSLMIPFCKMETQRKAIFISCISTVLLFISLVWQFFVVFYEINKFYEILVETRLWW